MSFFSLEEMRGKNGDAYPAEWVTSRWPILRDVLNAIRLQWRDTIVIVSGYRSPAYNDALRAKGKKAAKNSQHMHGRAADIRPAGARNTPDEVYRLHQMILAMSEAGKLPALHGLGKYPRWVHVDTRESNRLHRWG